LLLKHRSLEALGDRTRQLVRQKSVSCPDPASAKIPCKYSCIRIVIPATTKV